MGNPDWSEGQEDAENEWNERKIEALSRRAQERARVGQEVSGKVPDKSTQPVP